MNGIINKPTRNILLFSLGYAIIVFAAFLATGWNLYINLIWNLFLALLPLGFAVLTRTDMERSRKGWIILWVVLWLLFFPNAPYMITDLIHVNAMTFYVPETIYSTDLRAWIRMLAIAGGVLLGMASGLYSLFIFHRMALEKRGKAVAHGFLTVVSLLSGYGIYLGRFLRLNSWDLMRPLKLFGRILKNMNGFCLQYTLLMAGCILCGYAFFYVFFRAGEEKGCENVPSDTAGTNLKM